MREVLSVQYSASTNSLFVSVAAVRESEHVPGTFVRQLGAPEPAANFDLDDLPEEHRTAFRSLLVYLLEGTETKHAAEANDPEKLAAKASALAVREARLREEEKANAELSSAIEEKRRALAALDAELEEKSARSR